MPTTIVSDYERYLQAEKGMTAAARRGYLATVQTLMELALTYPQRFHLPASWQLEDLDKRALEIYLNHLRDARGWAPATLALQTSALRSFFDYLQRLGRVERNPARYLLPRLPPRDPRPPEGEEAAVRALFDAEPRRLTEAREQLLLELCYGAGLRPAVIWRIHSLRVLARAGALRIVAGEETLEVPLAAEGLERARRYLALRREACGRRRGAPFWVDERGRVCSPARLSRQVSQAMERAGLVGGPMALRQLAARHFAERGGDMRSMQRMLHARRLGSLDRYAPPDFQSVQRQFRRIHPRQQQAD